jgi:transcription initiation factor TFIIIB Brf1 subunit/transcription initiation factor TFIIB
MTEQIPGQIQKQAFLIQQNRRTFFGFEECAHVPVVDSNGTSFCKICAHVIGTSMVQSVHELGQDSFSNLDLTINSQIDARNRDAGGRALGLKSRRTFTQMRLWQRKFNSASPQRRNLYAVQQQLSRILNMMKLPIRLKGAAISYYQKVYEVGASRGQNVSAIAATLLYVVATKSGLGYAFDQFSKTCMADDKQVAKAYKAITLKMGQYLVIPSASAYVTRYVYYVDAKTEARNDLLMCTLQILNRHPELDDGRNPGALAAALILLLAPSKNLVIHVSQFSKKVHISAVTLKAKMNLLRSFV